ncbi:limonene-1,2-epoxide hydrolase family protein [Pseudonocardia pini]|uniref:limonene-1,2-epoxide hydrolase family protein n=1 Tax=Pseudonocardia pini TaxID=2758030 RepID=UPI0015F0571F|nr:limonene-1,2-epoxide hydrolase family protein [Pseudonocardia pini]
MTASPWSATDTVRAFLSALGAGERAGLARFLADAAEYRGSGTRRPTSGGDRIASVLGLLYGGTGTTVELVAVETRGGAVVSERRDHLRTGETLTVRAVATVTDGRITAWTDLDPGSRLGRLAGGPERHDTRGPGWRPTSTLSPPHR